MAESRSLNQVMLEFKIYCVTLRVVRPTNGPPSAVANACRPAMADKLLARHSLGDGGRNSALIAIIAFTGTVVSTWIPGKAVSKYVGIEVSK